MHSPSSLQRQCQNQRKKKKKNKFSNFNRRQKDDKNSKFQPPALGNIRQLCVPLQLGRFHISWSCYDFCIIAIAVFNISKEKNTSLTIVVNSQSCKDIVQFSPGRRHKLHSCTPSHVAQVTLLQKEPKTFKFCTCPRKKEQKWLKIILLSISFTFPWQRERQYQL